jgi:oligosaccharide repeat unit polymerase
LAGGLIAVAAACAGLLALFGVPLAWSFWVVCLAATLPVVLVAFARGRAFEPLPVLAGAALLLFVLRPLQLFTSWRDLYSWYTPPDLVDRLTRLDAQEMARFVSERLQEPLADALARAGAACALFLVALLMGYSLSLGRSAAGRLARLRGPERRLNVRVAIAASLALGLAAQAAILVRGEGPAAAFERASEQATLSDSFVLFVLAGFATAGLIVWAAWARPRGRLQWAGFVAALLAVAAFSVAAGSRARIFVALLALVVVVHYVWRPWRRRELLAAFLVLLAFASSFVAFRNLAEQSSLREATREAPARILDLRVILNDITSYDHVVYAASIYGRERGHERGAFLAGGVRSFVPGFLDPGKPEGGDIVFRRAVWGETYLAGRPPTAVGDLWIDFGFAGVALGAILIGLVARSLLGLVAAQGPGREYRAALYAIALVILLTLVVDTFSLALGYVFTLLLPFLVTVHALGRLRSRA